MEMVIGLEVHCQLATATKLFCACPSGSFGAKANTAICPVCTGQPGILPVLNARAVELAYTAALALNCRLAQRSIFARKNYFYPDLPKGYQISQYEEPFSSAGHLDLSGPPTKRVGIHRIHMEEDAGKLVHSIGSQDLDCSLVDFNRSSVALIEIVSEPDMRSPEEAFQYLTALKAVLQYAGISRCDMEKGEMRCDANVSARADACAPFGTRVEIKNLNSFKNVRDAIEYEFRRQCEALARGEAIVQETRLWDAKRSVTEPLRSKEEAHDYRYFPEPDLPVLEADQKLIERLRSTMPELPAARRARFESEYALSAYDAGVLTSDRALAEYFEAATRAAGDGSAKAVANWIGSELLARLNAENKGVEASAISARALAQMVSLIQAGTISGKMGKEVFAKMWETGKYASEIISELGMSQVSDTAQLAQWVDAALAENPRAVEDLRAGKDRAIGAIVGSVMKKSKGQANPARVNELIRERIRMRPTR